MVNLRPYQTASVEAIYTYFTHREGNPLIVLPTGAGKSLTMAAFIKGAIDKYPGTRIMLLTHVKELIEQDAKAIIRYWNDAPVGIWSAGVGSKKKDQITVAGIQSVHRLPAKFGGTDLVLIDECHLVPRDSDTMYRRFLDKLREYNPNMKIVGFTATHYRMDSGVLTEGEDRIFDDVAYEASVGDLIKDGYLCPLVAKNGATKADLSHVHTRKGDFIQSELQSAMDKSHLINGALDEVELYAHDRHHILGFCAGVEHAEHCAEAARARGWTADFVSGDMGKKEREAKLKEFTSGRLRFLFNAMLLTTGFDYPSIDCIVMLRPTKSTGLYVQIMGRGLRMEVKSKRSNGEGGVSVAPVKECPECHELVYTSVMKCPGCGHEWLSKPTHGTEAADAVIVAALESPTEHVVTDVAYREFKKGSKSKSVRVTYYCGLTSFNEWLPIEDQRSFVRKHAVSWFWRRGLVCPETVDQALAMANEGKIPKPSTITVQPDGKYWKVTGATFNWEQK